MPSACPVCCTFIADGDREKVDFDGKRYHMACLTQLMVRRMRRDFGPRAAVRGLKDFHPVIIAGLEKRRIDSGRSPSKLTATDRAFAKPYLDFLECACRIHPEYDPTLKFYLEPEEQPMIVPVQPETPQISA